MTRLPDVKRQEGRLPAFCHNRCFKLLLYAMMPYLDPVEIIQVIHTQVNKLHVCALQKKVIFLDRISNIPQPTINDQCNIEPGDMGEM